MRTPLSAPLPDVAAIAAEEEILRAHFDEEAGPHSVTTAAESGLRVVAIAYALARAFQRQEEALRRADALIEHMLANGSGGGTMRDSVLLPAYRAALRAGGDTAEESA